VVINRKNYIDKLRQQQLQESRDPGREQELHRKKCVEDTKTRVLNKSRTSYAELKEKKGRLINA